MKLLKWTLLFGFLLLSACNLPKPPPPTPTATTVPSATPTATPTMTPTATPLVTPTPQPSGRIGAGDKALANGDYFQAREEYQAALVSSSDDLVRAAALWGLGKTNFLYENYPLALENLRALVQTYAQSAHTARAHFLLGETYFNLQRYQESADAYATYLKMRPGVLEAYVQEKRGDAFAAIGNYTNALDAYQNARQAPGQADELNIRIKIANTAAYAGETDIALSMYDEIYTTTSNDYVKVTMDLLAGQAYIAQGNSASAYERWQRAVEFSANNKLYSVDAYFALAGLVNAGQSVDEFNRGLVDYNAKQYGVALQAFDRYITANPNHDGTALFYKGLAQFYLGNYEEAVQTWTDFIQNYPNNPYWATAWYGNFSDPGHPMPGRAYAQWERLDQYDIPATDLIKFSTDESSSPLASTYLKIAARIYESAGKLEKAATIWESLANKYPNDNSLSETFFQAGITRYRQENYPAALKDFQDNLTLVTDPADRARALLWIGKTYQVTGDPSNAANAWQEAQSLSSTSYYSIRARDLLNGTQPFAAPPSINRNYDLNTEQTEAAAWVRVKFNLPPETNLSDPGTLASDLRLQRGSEYWQLGFYDQARLEFEDLRAAVKTNPADSFRLGNYLLALGVYRPAIFAIREVLTLAGLDDHAESLGTPAYFKHVRYGLYFADMVWPAAAENGLDPLFVTSLVRQESLFEGFVRSSAGARGLMQVIPTTGASIAAQMGWPPNYSEDDLYSPYISLRMGTFYLNANRRLLNGDMYAALAAYNGGPGNAQIWQGLAKGDQDLQLEVIRFYETRDYIRSIYETYSIYRSIYSPMQ